MSPPSDRNAETCRSDAAPGADPVVSRILRAADPAAGKALPPIERAAMRQVVIETAARSRPHSAAVGPWSRLAFAAAVLIAGGGLSIVAMQGGLGDRLEPATDRAGTPADGTGGAGEGVAAAPGTEATGPGNEAITAENRATTPENEVVAPENEAGAPGTGAVADATASRGEPVADPTAELLGVRATTAPVMTTPPEVDRSRRTLQFTAPRGTRIIWTLDPTFESPIDGLPPDQEEAP